MENKYNPCPYIENCKQEYSEIILEVLDVDNCSAQDLKHCGWNTVLFEDMGLAQIIKQKQEVKENGSRRLDRE